MIKANEPPMISKASQTGIVLYRVIKPSINPAIIKNGKVLTTILSPSLAARVNDSLLEKVLGNKIPLPITIPAQPATTITESSIAPCNMMFLEACQKTSLLANMVKKAPTMTPLENKI